MSGLSALYEHRSAATDRWLCIAGAAGKILGKETRMRLVGRTLGLVVLAGLGACSDLRITEDTPNAVTVRYDGVVQTLADATAVAQRICGTYGKTARLRTTDVRAALERFAHFDCVAG
jgi:hypothetical protein